MPEARRLLAEYQAAKPTWQTDEDVMVWYQSQPAREHDDLLWSLMHALLHGVPLQAMGFPGRYPHTSGGVGGIEPIDPRDWDNAERRKRDPQRADIVYDGDDSP
jgi:hypothetical protein